MTGRVTSYSIGRGLAEHTRRDRIDRLAAKAEAYRAGAAALERLAAECDADRSRLLQEIADNIPPQHWSEQ